jgi:hypothetical protein
LTCLSYSMGGMRFRAISAVPAFAMFLILATQAGAQQSAGESSSKPRAKQTPTPRAAVIDRGSVVDGVYRNPSFGFTYKIPFGWVERTDQVQEDSSDPAKTLVLLSVFERPPEATGDTINSAVVIAAEKISSYSGLKTAADYFGPLTELATAKGFKVDNEPYEFSVGAMQLVRGDFSNPRGSLTMHQTSLVMLEKGYAVSFTFIGGSEDEVDQLIEKLSFATKAIH